ncbi:MAG TPA: DNA cytosine methyltransferase [Verrucomicrobiales bacterium]|nr:DNA cytosine methyltransferase [Verrucomicrobiales bacterium]
MKNTPTFIDLFCGCGGFSLGLERAGFKGLAAIDFNPEAVQVFQANFRKIPHILEKDLTKFSPDDLAALIGTNRVDLIVGGPPCQGFSTARQVDGANHGARLMEDPRRHLYKEFLRHVEFFQPKVFVMENVLGIRSASGGQYFTNVQAEARKLGYRVHAQIEECVKLGVPQKRRRQLFIGTRADLPGYFYPKLKLPNRAIADATLWEAIGDLPLLKAGEGEESRDYDISRRVGKISSRAYQYLTQVLQVDKAAKLTAHRARPHSARDLGDFLKLKEGENSGEAIKRGVEFDFPYDKTTFKDRYTRQHRHRPCSTIVAHLAKDGLMFIHPTQNRTLTPREASRVQSFPDWFLFPIARTHQFRVIGNAVPPLVAEAVGTAVKCFLNQSMKHQKQIKFDLSPLPCSEKEAVRWLVPMLDLDSRALKEVPIKDFKKAWYSISFLFMGLHPDSALEHGKEVSYDNEDYSVVSKEEPRLINPRYVQSGWPVVLARIAKEAWRRYEKGFLVEEEFYCSDAQMAGACFRNPELLKVLSDNRQSVA